MIREQGKSLGYGSSDPPEDVPYRPPVLSDGVELIGEYEGSGFREPPSLVRRRDGQVLQFPPLLYELLRTIDGQRDLEALASVLSDRVQRRLQAEDVAFLIEEKLRPKGVVAAPDGSNPELPRTDPFLAFRYRIGVISEPASARLGGAFSPLFFWPATVIVIAGFVLADWWLFFDRGVAQALRQTLYHPGLFLPLLAAVVLSAAFHEIGHAGACRYGGARPGRMGCGLYLAWPAFYTDVTDAYRLSRRGRLRTDLGGIYFNLVIIVVAAGVYLLDHSLEVLVLLVVIEHLEIVHQLLPVIRLDGYYVVSDLTGVPDLFARIGPVLRSVMFWRDPDPRVGLLKRWVRVTVAAWVFVVLPLLVLESLVVLVHLPRILGTAWDSADRLASEAGRAFDRRSRTRRRVGRGPDRRAGDPDHRPGPDRCPALSQGGRLDLARHAWTGVSPCDGARRLGRGGHTAGVPAAARLQCTSPILISRVRYAVIRPCGSTAGQNLLSSKVPLTAAPETNALVRVSWPYQAPQAVLQGTPTLGGTWSTFPGTPVVEGGGTSVLRFSPPANSQFFRLNLVPQ